jgi:hypothetical protein
MTTIDQLRQWHERGVIREAQYQTLAALVSKERFSLSPELNAGLYAGVVAFVFGLGWTFQTYFAAVGDLLIVTTFSLLVAACIGYCFWRGRPYSHHEVQSPSMVFDHVLFLGCLILSAELAFIEFRFHLLRGTWDYYLLLTAAAFSFLAYRFDNRFVLSLALTSLAGWFGVKVSAFYLVTPNALRVSAIVYAATVVALGAALFRQRIKLHFFQTFYHVAANVAFAALLSGVGEPGAGRLYLPALAMLAVVASVAGVWFERFAFVAYGVVYGYLGISYQVLAWRPSATFEYAYFIVTGSLVVVALFMLARGFGHDE